MASPCWQHGKILLKMSEEWYDYDTIDMDRVAADDDACSPGSYDHGHDVLLTQLVQPSQELEEKSPLLHATTTLTFKSPSKVENVMLLTKTKELAEWGSSSTSTSFDVSWRADINVEDTEDETSFLTELDQMCNLQVETSCSILDSFDTDNDNTYMSVSDFDQYTPSTKECEAIYRELLGSKDEDICKGQNADDDDICNMLNSPCDVNLHDNDDDTLLPGFTKPKHTSCDNLPLETSVRVNQESSSPSSSRACKSKNTFRNEVINFKSACNTTLNYKNYNFRPSTIVPVNSDDNTSIATAANNNRYGKAKEIFNSINNNNNTTTSSLQSFSSSSSSSSEKRENSDSIKTVKLPEEEISSLQQPLTGVLMPLTYFKNFNLQPTIILPRLRLPISQLNPARMTGTRNTVTKSTDKKKRKCSIASKSPDTENCPPRIKPKLTTTSRVNSSSSSSYRDQKSKSCGKNKKAIKRGKL